MNSQYKCLTPLVMFYMMVKLITILVIYKIVAIGPIQTTAATIIIPLWFLTGDIIAEVYGYDVAKQVIWTALITQFIFAFLCALLIRLPSTSDWTLQGAYNQVLGRLPWVVWSSFAAIVLGAFINAYIVSRWKVLLNGKLFWLRSLGASIIGEAVFVVISLCMEYIGVVSWQALLQLILVSFALKIVINPLLVFPSALLVAFIKKIEKIDVYDYDLDFNPLKIRLTPPTNDTLYT